ncbi:uncharacterized protein LOC128223791 [Mya arenaria]|uniref:uncharacterized protein LOC128223791 n=1 Tax=Mya arenaria TaxID=6604 RepID=UPI0022E8DB92|nr:uncharacterized protein LOC128223791 [Mya arenaria]XP_052789146.1 uncharacterized protein LOC128223791 [Mya arenaria]
MVNCVLKGPAFFRLTDVNKQTTLKSDLTLALSGSMWFVQHEPDVKICLHEQTAHTDSLILRSDEVFHGRMSLPCIHQKYRYMARYTYTTRTVSKILRSPEACPGRMLFYAAQHSQEMQIDG